jgi:hypothetical protein
VSVQQETPAAFAAQIGREFNATAEGIGLSPGRCPQCGRHTGPGELFCRRVEVFENATDGAYVRVATVAIGCAACVAKGQR